MLIPQFNSRLSGEFVVKGLVLKAFNDIHFLAVELEGTDKTLSLKGILSRQVTFTNAKGETVTTDQYSGSFTSGVRSWFEGAMGSFKSEKDGDGRDCWDAESIIESFKGSGLCGRKVQIKPTERQLVLPNVTKTVVTRELVDNGVVAQQQGQQS